MGIFPETGRSASLGPEFLEAIRLKIDAIDSRKHRKLESDQVVAEVRSNLVSRGWEIEAGKKAIQKIS